MRIRIVKQPSGVVDGVDLSQLVEGNTYDVLASIGTLLVVDGEAVPVDDAQPVLVLPLDHPVAKGFRAGSDKPDAWVDRREPRNR